MRPGGTTIFTDPDDYRTSIPGAEVGVAFARGREFSARVTYVALLHVRLTRVEELLPRIAHVSLAPEWVFVTFSTRSGTRRIYRGTKLRWGDLIFHARGERFQERTGGSAHWGIIALPAVQLAAYAKALKGRDIVPPSAGQILRPPPATAARLRRLHAKACRLVETRPEILARRQAIRALEHDLIHALVDCLTASDARGCASASANVT
jgi:hypothetical protein